MEKNASTQVNNFLSQLEDIEAIEEKLRFCLDVMKKTLSYNPIPAFREFWEAKRSCLDLFKERIPPRVRTLHWTEYIQLSEEARQVKEILDEKSSFAHEQIILAVEAMEKEMEGFEARLFEISGLEIPQEVNTLQKNRETYLHLQKQLDLLNAFAGRLNGMRKELIHTQMRMRGKNQLFERLSKLGDQVFPRRKTLIQELSDLYLEDVEAFVCENFSSNRPPHYSLKDEIKALQAFAKVLTINSETFSRARESLSRSWQQIKEVEKQQHQKRVEERDLWKMNLEEISPKIATLKEECAEGKISLKEAEAIENQILEEIKESPIGPEVVRKLRKELQLAKKPLVDKERQLRKKHEEEKVSEQKKQTEAQQLMLKELHEVLDQADVLPLEALVGKWETLVKGGKTLCPIGSVKAMLEHRLDHLFDYIQEKRWWGLQEESDRDLSSDLHALLDERHKARRKLKETLEQHRKIVGGSGLDFEQSMLYQDLISEEKLRLDAIETMIEEMEEKLFDIEE